MIMIPEGSAEDMIWNSINSINSFLGLTTIVYSVVSKLAASYAATWHCKNDQKHLFVILFYLGSQY